MKHKPSKQLGMFFLVIIRFRAFIFVCRKIIDFSLSVQTPAGWPVNLGAWPL